MDLVDEQQRALPLSAPARAAASKIFLSSATPEWMAETCTKASGREAPISRATVVLPLPGGPQKIIEPRVGDFEQAGQRAVRPGQMLLARDFGERPRPQALGERRRRRFDLGPVRGIEKAHVAALSRAGAPLSSRMRRRTGLLKPVAGANVPGRLRRAELPSFVTGSEGRGR